MFVNAEKKPRGNQIFHKGTMPQPVVAEEAKPFAVPVEPKFAPIPVAQETEVQPPMLAPLPFPPKPSPLPAVFEEANRAVERAIGYGVECERNLEAMRGRCQKLETELGAMTAKAKDAQPSLDRVSLSLYRREAELEKATAELEKVKRQRDDMAEKLANRMGGGDPFNEADTPLLRAAMALAVSVDPHVQDRHRKAYLRRRGWKMDESGWTDPVQETTGHILEQAVQLQAKRDAEGHRTALENLVTGIDAL